ncbi:p-loop containing nucleoside triphosphate hydrolase protein [Mycena sanguinolenta]|uniref:p-loop containing nucleoside triphosphate hydrolase protein n=1 Tax=Mycena sanguinolenta TaxID=230812 RepID=A0A8H6ZF33_9AGAR|nr:p-loop containing nucleoside triphosphate hydrolase protein [Mycena sanguinolenta]
MLVRWCRLHACARSQRFLHNWKPPPHLTAWQRDALEACMNAIDAGRTKIGMHIAQGQTNTLAALIDRMLHDLNAKQILVVAASGQEQLAKEILVHHPQWTADIYTKVTVLSKADVFLTSYNNMLKDDKNMRDVEKGLERPDKRNPFVQRYNKSAIKVAILTNVDELTRLSLDALLPLLRSPCPPDANEPSPLPIVVGTSSSNDFNALRRLEFIEEVVYQRMFLDHIRELWECNALFYAVPTPLGLRNIGLRAQGPLFAAAGISKVMCRSLVIKKVVREWQERAATRKSTLVYCVGDIHSKTLARAFKEAGIDARDMPQAIAYAKPDSKERALYDEQMTAFEAGRFPVLLVSHSRVVNVPRIDCVVLAAPVLERYTLANMVSAIHSNADRPCLYAFQISSGMKSSPETSKENCLVIDILDQNFRRSPACSTSTLFQLDPLDIDEQSPDVLRELGEKKALLDFQNTPPKPQVAPPQQPNVELMPIGEDEALQRQANQEAVDVVLKSVTQFLKKRRWVLCAPGIYVHDNYDRGHALLRRVDIEGMYPIALPSLKQLFAYELAGETLYEAYWTNRRLLEGTSESGKTETVKLSLTGKLEDILQHLSQFLRECGPPRPGYRKMKATKAQLATLKELIPEETMSHVVFEGAPMARDAFLEWLSVGQASDAIARLRYRTEPDLPPFSHVEQANITNNIRKSNSQRLGEACQQKSTPRDLGGAENGGACKAC